MKWNFPSVEPPEDISSSDWSNWQWQMRRSLKTTEDFARFLPLNDDEVKGFELEQFKVSATPYYAKLASTSPSVRRILVPHRLEGERQGQHLFDPLGENQNRPSGRIIHRYADRALFLVTDICAVYCRYCTRKHFTATEQAFPKEDEYEKALQYLRETPQIREVILSGGDPLTLSDRRIERVLSDLREIESVEIIRIGTRMPIVNPMRVSESLVEVLRAHHPVFVMLHFNHPHEITHEAAQALERLADAGLPLMNQMVLLNGVNNHAAVVRELGRRLLRLRVKPYYLFQCDPSIGTDYLRTTIEQAEAIQRELWGHLSGLAMPSFSLDVPDGGGKIGLMPQFELSRNGNGRTYRGFDGIQATYQNPTYEMVPPSGLEEFLEDVWVP